MNTLPNWLVAACLIPIAFGVGCAAAAVLSALVDLADRAMHAWRHRHEKPAPQVDVRPVRTRLRKEA